MKKEKADSLLKKREEAERKARRGEIDPTHEFTFQLICQISGMLRHDIMESMFSDPIMLDELDFLYKNDMARKVLFFRQARVDEDKPEAELKRGVQARKARGLAVMQEAKNKDVDKDIVMKLFTTDGLGQALTGLCMYFIRLTTKRALGEETFQREILCGVISASVSENILWTLERIISTIFIPLLNTNMANDKGNELLSYKVRKELLPCLRSFTSCLRVAEMVWIEGLLIEHFPPESETIENLDDSWALLATADGQKRFEEAVRQWMKAIYELLLESEQLRLETDDAGPQVGQQSNNTRLMFQVFHSFMRTTMTHWPVCEKSLLGSHFQ